MNFPSQRPLSLPIQKWMKKESTGKVMEALTRKGGAARFVGGCVRDTLAGRVEPDNIDIATPLKPEEVLLLLQEQGLTAIPTGIEHGTITAVVDHEVFEITTLRADLRTDGRHAVVEYTDSWEVDAHRRDFTMNSIYCDLEGNLYDPVGGIEDLHNKKIRFIGAPETRIQEDILRILRYFRFQATFENSDVDRTALAACTKLAPKLQNLSGERICSELFKWLAADNPVPSLAVARGCGVLENILTFSPTHAALKILQTLVTYEQQCGDPDPARRLYVLAPGKTTIQKTAHRLKLPKAITARLKKMGSLTHLMSVGLSKHAARKIIYFNGKQTFIDGLLATSASFPQKKPPDWIELHHLANAWTPPKCPITGEDIQALGIPQGPLVGQLTSEVEKWWLESNFEASRSETLDQLTNLVNKIT
jgi:poly(A) polymerase